MKTSLTIKILSFFTLLLVTVSLTAQLKFEVTSPSGISGEYEMATAEFGGTFPNLCNGITSITGELMIGDDGTGNTTDACEALVNDLTGKIALIDRGICNFDQKCLNAQMAGAIAVMVCDSVAGGTPFPMGSQDVGDQVTVPCFMIGKDDCDLIRVEVPTVEIAITFQTDTGSDNVLWGDQTGEGDFNGGLNGWTTVNDELNCPGFDLWRWSANGTATDGAFSAGGGVIQSTSACNGAMAFDSDFYDNNGNSGNLGGGDCPADQIGELISPTIDLGALTNNGMDINGVSLKFRQATRQFTSTYIVSYSNDDGLSWNDIEINTEIPVNSDHLNQEMRIFLPDADLTTNTFKFKFRYEANYYYWIIDDVQLIQAENNNLRVMSNFFAIAPNAVWPISQVEPYSHLADIYNAGAATQTNVNLSVTITDENNNVVFTDTNAYGAVVPDTLVENQPFPNYFTPDGSAPNTYEAVYSISSDSMDFDLSDNTQTYTFITSEATFAKEFGPSRAILPAPGNWEGAGEPHSWAYGNYFYIVNGEDWGASSATFVIGNSNDAGIPGRVISIYLYRWDEDSNEDSIMDPDERTRVAFAIYEIIGNETSQQLITVPLNVFPTNEPGPVTLESNQAYVLMVEYVTNDEVDFEMMAGEINYGAMTLRSELDGVPAARYGSVLGINGDLESEPYSTFGFNTPLAPVVRLNLGMIVGTDNQLDAANTLAISPNPANNTINVKVDLVEAQDMVSLRIMDVAGKMVLEQNYRDFQRDNLQFDVSRFANGAYFLHFITEDGIRTERFIIQR